jgi:hypothetical protein
MGRELNGIRYEKTISQYEVRADDISIYPQLEGTMPGQITYGGRGKAEQKDLPIRLRLINNDGSYGLRGRHPQVVIELCGDYHVETLAYPTINPKDWFSYGKVWLSRKAVKELIERLQMLLEDMELLESDEATNGD